MTNEEIEELKQDALWEKYLEAKEMESNYEYDEPKEEEDENN